MAIWEVALRIGMAIVIGGAVGIQREIKKGNSAGLRTHMLVALGACIAMITSEYFFEKYGADSMDISRIAAGVISGIGFLGAGSIIKDGIRVRGLTTAAGLWVVACLGVAAGSGFYLAAGIGTALAVIVIWALKTLEKVITKKKHHTMIVLRTINAQQRLADVMHFFGEQALSVISVDVEESDEGSGTVTITTSIPKVSLTQLTEALAKIEEMQVISVEIID